MPESTPSLTMIFGWKMGGRGWLYTVSQGLKKKKKSCKAAPVCLTVRGPRKGGPAQAGHRPQGHQVGSGKVTGCPSPILPMSFRCSACRKRGSRAQGVGPHPGLGCCHLEGTPGTAASREQAGRGQAECSCSSTPALPRQCPRSSGHGAGEGTFHHAVTAGNS